MDKDQWITVDPGTKPTTISDEDWKKLDRKAKSIVRLCSNPGLMDWGLCMLRHVYICVVTLKGI